MERVWFKGSVGIIFILLAITQLHLVIESVTVTRPDPTFVSTADTLPVHRRFIGAADITVRFSRPSFGGNDLRIIPDERLSRLVVNSRVFDLTGVAPEKLGDWRNGVQLDLTGYLQPGANILIATIENHDSDGGISLDYLPLGFSHVAPYVLLTLGAMLVFSALSSGFKLQRSLQVIAYFSLALVCLYWMQTPFSVRQFDIYEGGGHLDYLRYLLEHHQVPPANQGWEYHQPPGYYFTAAWAYWLGNKLPLLGWPDLLRLVSLLYWMLFIAAGLAIIQLYLRRYSWRMCLAAFTFCCWPAGFIHALRVGNDVAFYAWYALGLWATCQWWRTRRQSYFVWASLCCLLVMLAKANGVALLATLAALLIYRWWRESRRVLQTRYEQLSRSTVLFAVMLLLSYGMTFASKLHDYKEGRSSDWLLGNVTRMLNERLRVSNDWHHLLGFELTTFLHQPWLSAWQDATGRQYFWNYVLRSSLSSEFAFRDEFKPWALLCGGLLLLLLGHLLLRAVVGSCRLLVAARPIALRTSLRVAPLVISGLTLLLLLWAYRFKTPYAMHSDFRYIYPALISVVALDALMQPRSSIVWWWAAPLAPVLGLLGVCLIALLCIAPII